MGNRRCVDVFLAIFLAIGFVAVVLAAPAVSSARGSSASRPDGLPGLEARHEQALVDVSMIGADQSHLYVLPETAPALAGWQQANSNGFGDQLAIEVSALEEFNGYLYAGTYNPTNDARIFRSPDGATWTPVTEPGFGNSHDIAPPAILDMAVFQNRLYATTGRGNASQLWRTLNGVIWAPMDVTGFSDPDNTDITALAEYGGKLYAGVTNQVTGAQIWSSYSGDNNSWTQVGPTTPGITAAAVTAFQEFDGGLHAAIAFESNLPAQIWRSYGGDWETIVSDGFGNNNTMMTGGMAVYGGFLYVGAGNITDGAQLWRTNDGTNWQQVITPAFGDTNNQQIEMVVVFQNVLYISTKNTVTGMEIWRSADGTTWEQVNQDGFGDSDNSGSNWGNASAAFLGKLYLGTTNAIAGGELWRMTPPFAVNLSPDDARVGWAGQSVVYTVQVTNTGNLSDTYDLALSGQSWSTLLSTSQVSLAPAASTAFTISVTIPVGTLSNITDAVTVTATSHGNGSVTDLAVLTTKCAGSMHKIYLPMLSRVP